MQCCQIIEAGATGNRDLVRLGIDFGQLMARVVALELRFFAWLGGKRDRPAELQDHLRHGIAQSPDLVVVLVEVFGDVAGFGIAHMDVQQRCAGVVTVHRGLDLFVPGDGKFLFRSAIHWHPDWPIGRGGDHQRGLIFG